MVEGATRLRRIGEAKKKPRLRTIPRAPRFPWVGGVRRGWAARGHKPGGSLSTAEGSTFGPPLGAIRRCADGRELWTKILRAAVLRVQGVPPKIHSAALSGVFLPVSVGCPESFLIRERRRGPPRVRRLRTGARVTTVISPIPQRGAPLMPLGSDRGAGGTTTSLVPHRGVRGVRPLGLRRLFTVSPRSVDRSIN